MHKPLILVTGATGKTGAATAIQLLAKGYPVRALVRRNDVRSERLKNAGAQIMAGSMEDPTDMRAAMAGVDRAYYCPPLEPGTLRRAALFAAIAQESRVELVVVLSQWLADATHPAIHAREKWLSSQVFDWAPGLNVVTVNPGFFADNYMLALEGIAHFGLFAMPLGDGLNAPPSNEDIARVIVGALEHPADHVGKTYRPTGPALLSPGQIAQAFGRALGRKVKYQNAPMKLFLKVARSLNIDDFVIEELYWFLQDYQRNSFGLGAPTDAVLRVAGVEPESFDAIVGRYVQSSPFRHRTLASTLLASHNLVSGLLTRTPNLAAIVRQLQLPQINHPELAADSATWIASHAE
jgi:uncharacterized protein YbjT (DUF2867 family)